MALSDAGDVADDERHQRAIIWFGAVRIDAGAMHVGAMMASLQYAMQILFAVFMVTAMFVMLPRAAASAARINEVLDVGPGHHRPGRARSRPARSAVTSNSDNVTFQYPGAEEPALTGVSFTALPGEVTAIIGGTGSGQVHAGRADPALLRRQRWPRARGRRRRARVAAGRICARGSGSCRRRRCCSRAPSPSNIRFGRDDATDEDDPACRHGGAGRRVHRPHAGGLRVAGVAGRHQPLRRPEATAGDCAGARPAPGHLRLRRQLLGARLRHRRQAARGAQGARPPAPRCSSSRSALAR